MNLIAITFQEFYASYYPFIWVALAFVAGLLIMWLIQRNQTAKLKTRMEERERAARKSIADLEAASANLEAELSELRNTESILLKRQGELEAHVSSGQRRNAEQQQLLNEMEERFTNTFRNLSNDALRNSQEQFLTLAQQALRAQQEEAQGVFDKRHMAVEQLITPVATSLEKFQARVGEIEQARESAYSTLLDQVRHLAESQAHLNKETHRLVTALRQPTGRGQWGEMQLKRCVEMAGMAEHCEFLDHSSENSGSPGNLRPDLIVKLPGKQQVVIDSKAPMDAYLDAIEAEDEAQRESHLLRHASQISEHIHLLSSKDYQSQFEPKPEFVVLFLPSESFFSAALNNDPGLIEKGVDQGVILATPTTLIALLRAVSYGWRQEALADNARQISLLGGELHDRLAKLTNHFGNLGRSLNSTVQNFNEAMNSLESQVLPGARKFSELGAVPESQTLPGVPQLNIRTHSLTTPAEPIPETSNSLSFDESQPREPDASNDNFEGFTLDSHESENSSKANAAADDLRAALGGNS